MRARLVVPFVAALLAAGASQAFAQAAPKPPANDDCLACHDKIDAKAFAASTHGPMACVDCHADLATLQEFPHPDTLAKVNCASCHDDIGAKYHDSIHARAREKSGLIVAPACADCHGKHDVRPKTDPASRVFRANVETTCGTCHTGIKARYDVGVHAVAAKQGNSRAPTCIDCHTAHSIQRADTDAWHMAASRECGSCHAQLVESFTRTFHGKVTELGFARVAACADCHGAHDILPKANPASTISSKNIVATCQKCHQGANERFAQYDPHPNPHDAKRSPLLWWLNGFYTVLIGGCFGFFGLHSLLWFVRSRTEDRETRS